jgi:hypothetical protein
METNQMTILRPKRLAEQLGVAPSAVSLMVKDGLIPSGMLGGRRFFIQEDVENAIRANYTNGVRSDDLPETGDQECELITEKEESATTSASKESEYENSLKLVPKPKH